MGLTASYFALHMLRNLGIGFTMMAVYGHRGGRMRMLVAPLWGRAIDRPGAKPVLLFCSYGVSIIPLLWLLPMPEFILFPLAADVLLSGVLWGGHCVAAFALPLSLAPREGRPFYLPSFAMVGSVAFTRLHRRGGLLAQTLPDRFTLFGHELYDLHVLFLLASVSRIVAASWGLRIAKPGARPVPDLVRMPPGLLVPERVRARILLGCRPARRPCRRLHGRRAVGRAPRSSASRTGCAKRLQNRDQDLDLARDPDLDHDLDLEQDQPTQPQLPSAGWRWCDRKFAATHIRPYPHKGDADRFGQHSNTPSHD